MATKIMIKQRNIKPITLAHLRYHFYFRCFFLLLPVAHFYLLASMGSTTSMYREEEEVCRKKEFKAARPSLSPTPKILLERFK